MQTSSSATEEEQSMQVNIHHYSMRDEKWFPRVIKIPADKEQSFREWAQRNHGQTVERLNERGGLAPSEIWAIYHERSYQRLTAMGHIGALKLCVALAEENDSEKILT
jgi:hypothetical protein